jgi:hypothetical protein
MAKASSNALFHAVDQADAKEVTRILSLKNSNSIINATDAV